MQQGVKEEEEEEDEELRSPVSGGGQMNKVYVGRTSQAMPYGSGIRCKTISPFAGRRHYIQ